MTDDPSTNSGEPICVVDDCTWPARYGDYCNGHKRMTGFTPSPVQDSERPDTEELRSLASFMEGDDDARLLHAAADWIESAGWMWIKPAADQGPDLSEAAALLDEYDQSVHNLTRFGTVEAQTDHLLASERVAAFARRLLDREGGN